MKTKFLVRDKRFYIGFFALMIPIALQNLIALGASLADNVMISFYHQNALDGVALVNRMQFFLQMVIGGIGEGIVILTSQYWGQKNTARIKDIMGVGLRIAAFASVLMSLGMFFFARPYLGIFNTSPEVIEQGVAYMQIVAIGYLFICPTQILLSTLRSVETVRVGFFISIFSLGVNVLLNYLLIFGKIGKPLGTRGGAIATVTSQVIEFILLLIYIFKYEKKLIIRFKDMLRFHWKDCKQYFSKAAPMILSNGTWGIAMAVQTFILSSTSAAAVTADSISGNVFSFMTVLLYGASNGANILIGKTIGEDRVDDIPLYTRTLQILFLGLGLITGAAIFFSRDLFISLYSSQGEISPDRLALTRQFLTVLSVTSVGTAYQMSSLTGIVRGGGDTKFVFYNDMVFMWFIVLPLAAIGTFALKLSPLYIFMILKSDQILKCIVAFFKVNSFNWIRKVDA